MPLLTQYKNFLIPVGGDSVFCEELNTFLRGHRIINIEKKLVNSETSPCWAFLVEYGSVETEYIEKGKNNSVDYKEILTEKQFSVYDKLRQLRKEESDKLGGPPYIVFSNEQLAEMAINLPTTLKDLKKIKKVGDSKIKQFGEKFIKVIQEVSKEQETNLESSEKLENSEELETSEETENANDFDIF